MNYNRCIDLTGTTEGQLRDWIKRNEDDAGILA
jgi:hypothetical protein